jgi:hypothetical protein
LFFSACGGGGGGSAPSNSPPAAPQQVSASQGPGAQKINIAWAPVSGATSYNLYYSNAPAVSKATGTQISGVTSTYTHNQLNSGEYYYVVTAVNAHGESGESLAANAAVNLVSFVTSTRGNMDLSTWPDAVSAGTVTGLQAADAICQGRASAASLTGTFKAWISDSTTDAYCHLQGYSGKRSDNCGQGILPANAGPWVRSDGAPYAPDIAQMTSGNWGVFYTALITDETGTQLPDATSAKAASATNVDGSVWLNLPAENACNDWTNSASVTGATGRFVAIVHGGWTGYSWNCNESHPLVCMQAGTGPALTIVPASGKKVFITSESYDGDLGGLAGADAICRTRATAAGLPNAANFKAWLSDGSTDAISRITSNGPWVRTDGFRIADSKADLTDGTIFTAIDKTESGNTLVSGVWTGSLSDGVKAVEHCANWGDNTSGTGQMGNAAVANSIGWTSWNIVGCTNSFALYCFED